MGIGVFREGYLTDTEKDRYFVLKTQRENVGLNDTERDEFHILEDKLKQIK